MSVYASTGDGHHYKAQDIQRALICSIAVYLKRPEAEDFFSGNEKALTFEKVFLSENKEAKFLIAYAEDAFFIAFPGTDNLLDIACNLQANHVGSVHAGFYERGGIFDRSGCNPVWELLRGQKRVIFCGHSLGGAVAHVTLLRFLKDHYLHKADMKSLKEKFKDSLISIAFGSPYVCDKEMADSLKEKELRRRFLTVVNQDDPIPRIMVDLQGSLKMAVQHMRATKLEPILGGVNDRLAAVGGIMGRFAGNWLKAGLKGAKVAVTGVVESQEGLANAWKKAVKACARMQDSSTYSPIGNYAFVTQDKYLVVSSVTPEFTTHLGELRIDKKSLQHHTLSGYSDVVNAQFPLPGNLATSSATATSPNPKSVTVTSPDPKVSHAVLRGIEKNQTITVKGENLLFLMSPIRRNGYEEWQTIKQADEEIVARSEGGKKDTGDDSLGVVVVETAFGRAECNLIAQNNLSEENFAENDVTRMLRRVVQTIVMKAQPPLSFRPKSQDLHILDQMMACVSQKKRWQSISAPPGAGISAFMNNYLNAETDVSQKSQKKRFSERLLEIVNANANVDLTSKIIAVNTMVDDILLSLGNNLTLEFETSLFSKEGAGMVLTGLGLLMLGAGLVAVTGGLAAYALRGVYTLTAAGLGGAGAAAGITGVAVGGYLVGDSMVIYDDYRTVLGVCILGLIGQSGESQGPSVEASGKASLSDQTAGEASISELERQLAIAAGHYSFHDSEIDSLMSEVSFTSKLLENVSANCKRDLLGRIKVVASTYHLHLSLVNEIFVGVVGAEDCGKSTFIKKVLEGKRSDKARALECGPDVHTKNVTPYQITSNVWLVDFPGGNGTGSYADNWKMFTALPSFGLLLLDFIDDVKQPQVDMYNAMKAALEVRRLIVAFNKVDEKFTPRNEARYTEEYFKELRNKAATELDCPHEDVVFVTLDPDPEEKLEQLKSRGVLGFNELFMLLQKEAEKLGFNMIGS